MADINLRDYLARLESLVNSGEYTQVVHHCRHILQYFPRHADTYRLLGRALLDNNKWQEAAEVFNRLQSVNPSDYTAHISLADISNQLKRPDDAIWHLERAFEQQPNNQSLMDNLRDLYRRHRRQEYNRVQLTAGAAARQYIRNGLFEQAIRVLQEALQQTPERVDLRLLLAQTYREAGYYVEAGETSLDVLQTLPDCLDANLILAELWMSLQRPSDAQRYLERVQLVDPYAALQMVETGDVSADAFRLPELDFRRSVEREVLSGTPDWLDSVDVKAQQPPVPTNDLPGWSSFTPTSGAQTDDLQLASDFSQELPADWMQTGELPSSGPLPPVELPKRTSGMTGGLLSRFRTGGLPGTGQVGGSGQLPPMDEDDEETVFESAPILSSVPPPRNKPPTQEIPVVQERITTPDQTKQFDESLIDLLDAPTADDTQAPNFDENDPLYWMKASGIELEEPVNSRRTTASMSLGDDNMLAASDTDNPMAWMQDYDTGLLSDEPAPSRLDRQEFDIDEPVSVEANVIDPMAWMQGYGTGLLTDEATAERQQARLDEAAPDDADPLEWLHESGIKVIDDTPARSTATQQVVSAKADPLDWLSDDDSILNEALDMESLIENRAPSATLTEPQSTAAIDRQDAMPQSPDNDLNWLSSQEEPEPEEFDWSQTANPTEPPPEASRKSGMLNRFRTGNLPITNPVGDEPVMPTLDDSMDFMDDIPMPSTGPVGASSSAADDFDWSATPEQPIGNTGWLDDMMTADQAAPAASDVPDWLGGMNIPPPAQATTGWFESNVSEEEPASADPKRSTGLLNRFRTGNLPGTNPIPEEIPASEQPATGWLDDMMGSEPAAAADDSAWLMDTGALSGSSVRVTDELGWENSSEEDSYAQQEDSAWLMDTGPLSAPPATSTDDFSWAKSTQDIAPATGWLDNMMASEQPETPATQVPDWLSGMEEPPTAAPVSTGGLLDRFRTGNLPSTGSVAEDDGDWGDQGLGQSQPAAQVPDWLSGMEEPPTAAPVSTGGLLDRFRTGNLPSTGSVAEVEDDGWGDQGFGQPQTAAQNDVPEWLAQTGALVNAAPDPEQEINQWLAETGGLVREEEPTAQEDMPEWLSQTGELVELASAATQEYTPVSGWMDEIQPESTAPADWSDATSETGSWEDAPIGEEPTTDMLNRFQTGPLPTTGGLDSGYSATEEVPDWLSGIGATAAAVPGADEFEPEDDIATWMEQTGSLLESAAKSSSTNEWAVVDDEATPDQPSMTTTGLLNRFKTGNLPSTGPLDSDSDGTNFGWSAEAQPASESNVEAPDWLKNLDTSEVEAVVEPDIMPRPGTGPIDQIDWGEQPVVTANYVDETHPEAADIPEWLAGAEPADPEPAVAVPRAGTTPLDQIDWGIQTEAVAEEDYLDEEPVQQLEMPDWLAQAEPVELETEAPRADTPSLDEVDWDAIAEPVAEAAYANESDDQQVEMNDWLAEAEAEPDQPEAVAGEPLIAEAEPVENLNWMAQANETVDAQSEPVNTIEDDLSWMRSSELETEAVPDAEIAVSDEADWEAVAEPADPAWLEDVPISNDELLVEATPEQASSDGDASWEEIPIAAGIGSSDQPRDLPQLDSDWEEELVTSPALNAPDWLNDMVPGLDISYDIEEDALPEEGYAPAALVNPGTLRPKVDYAWLMDIADEESRYMLPLTDTVLARKRRYIFTREPVWLRQPIERRDAAPATAESDIDLPPWLQ